MRAGAQVRAHGAETEWMAFIDLDEFLHAARFDPIFFFDATRWTIFLDHPSVAIFFDTDHTLVLTTRPSTSCFPPPRRPVRFPPRARSSTPWRGRAFRHPQHPGPPRPAGRAFLLRAEPARPVRVDHLRLADRTSLMMAPEEPKPVRCS